MMKIQKSIALALFAMLIIISCRRESLPEDSNTQAGKEGSPAYSKVLYRISPAQLAAEKQAWLMSMRSASKDIAARGGCGVHVGHKIILNQVSGTCSGTSWTINYTILSFDQVGSGYALSPVSASFTDFYSSTPTVTLLDSVATLDDPNCIEWYWDGYCDMTREYEYELTNFGAPSSSWPADIGNFTLNLLSGFASNCTPLAVTGDLKGGYTLAEYGNMPARVTVTPTGGPGAIFVATDCSLICPPPYVTCPTGGTFIYWPLSNPSNTTTLSVSPVGNVFTNIPTGVSYGWSCTLNYTISGSSTTSLAATGNFNL